MVYCSHQSLLRGPLQAQESVKAGVFLSSTLLSRKTILVRTNTICHTVSSLRAVVRAGHQQDVMFY